LYLNPSTVFVFKCISMHLTPCLQIRHVTSVPPVGCSVSDKHYLAVNPLIRQVI